MDVIAYERRNQAEDPGLLAKELLSHDVYGLPEEDFLVCCPECGELAEGAIFLEHRSWCSRSREPEPAIV